MRGACADGARASLLHWPTALVRHRTGRGIFNVMISRDRIPHALTVCSTRTATIEKLLTKKFSAYDPLRARCLGACGTSGYPVEEAARCAALPPAPRSWRTSSSAPRSPSTLTPTLRPRLHRRSSRPAPLRPRCFALLQSTGLMRLDCCHPSGQLRRTRLVAMLRRACRLAALVRVGSSARKGSLCHWRHGLPSQILTTGSLTTARFTTMYRLRGWGWAAPAPSLTGRTASSRPSHCPRRSGVCR